MESPRKIHESKQLRWTSRPSEEQLLGPAGPFSARPIVSFQPPPVRDWAVSAVSVPDTFDGRPRWRPGGRDLVALAAVAAAVWFAVSGSQGLPFHSSSSAQPTNAAELVGTVNFDRSEMLALHRKAAVQAAQGTEAGSSGADGAATGSEGGSGSKHHPKPPSSDGSDPLLQANLPVLGTVTVDQPDIELPGGTPTLPLTDTGGVTLPTATLPTLP